MGSTKHRTTRDKKNRKSPRQRGGALFSSKVAPAPNASKRDAMYNVAATAFKTFTANPSAFETIHTNLQGIKNSILKLVPQAQSTNLSGAI
jgi:hypothetical protein